MNDLFRNPPVLFVKTKYQICVHPKNASEVTYCVLFRLEIEDL